MLVKRRTFKQSDIQISQELDRFIFDNFRCRGMVAINKVIALLEGQELQKEAITLFQSLGVFYFDC